MQHHVNGTLAFKKLEIRHASMHTWAGRARRTAVGKGVAVRHTEYCQSRPRVSHAGRSEVEDTAFAGPFVTDHARNRHRP